MNRSILFYLSIILINTVFYECKTSNKSLSQESPNSDINILAYYGNQIYTRESCSSCHTQLIEEENAELISIDGIGNKYPNSWYYYYFFDPTYTIGDSKKSSYSHLHSEPFDKIILRKIIIDNELKINEDTLWNKLVDQADIISSELNREGLIAYNSSVVALISYLQQIPASNRKKELDYFIDVEKMKKEKIWDNILQDSSRLATIIEDNKYFIDEGNSLFRDNCSACHGDQGGGLIGPNLTDEYWLHGGNKIDVAKTIVNGVPDKGMISWRSRLSPPEVGKLVAYLNSIRGTKPAYQMPPRGIKE